MLHDAVGIEKGMMTTIHSYTGDQPTLDTMHKDLYRARAAALSQIPTSTGAAKAIGLVLPELKGKLDGISIRVPTPNVSVVDFKFIAKRDTTVEEINDAIDRRVEGQAEGHPRPSRHIRTSRSTSTTTRIPRRWRSTRPRSWTATSCSVLSWYDNEWGFSNRMADTAVALRQDHRLIDIAQHRFCERPASAGRFSLWRRAAVVRLPRIVQADQTRCLLAQRLVFAALCVERG